MELFISQKAGDCTALEKSDTLYVHLCSGKVVEVRPATAVRVTEESVEVFRDQLKVASFPRSDVYFASDEPIEPPSFE